MTLDEYEKLPPEEKEHFAAFHHTGHKHRPDIQYSRPEKLH